MGRNSNSIGGSIYRRGDKWRGQIIVGGKRRSVTGRTKKEVSDKLAELKVEYNKGALVERNDVTFQEWSDYWLEVRKKPTMNEASYLRVQGHFKKHFQPYFAGRKLQSITTTELEEMYPVLFAKKSMLVDYKEQSYSIKTVQALSVYLKNCFQFAVDRNIISKNPHSNVLIAGFRAPKKVDSYTSADQKRIVDTCKSGKEANRIFYFLISTGMRLGEACALTWDDINLQTGAVNITKTVVNIRGALTIQNHPKTAAGVRTIYLSPNTLNWLIYHKETMSHKGNLVFPNMRGSIISESGARRFWIIACEDMGIEYKCIHALRHTFATRALESGVNIKVLSDMLGHSDVYTTMNIYQDVLDDQKIKAMCTMNALF